MLRKLRLNAGRGIAARLAAPAFFATAFFIANPSSIALQDMSSLISGGEASADRWKVTMLRPSSGSIHQGEVPFGIDPTVTGSVGVRAKGVGDITLNTAKTVLPETPDEMRINTKGKSGRVAAIIPAAPPKDFSAGSVFERQSNLLRPTVERSVKMAFIKPEIKGKEIQIAKTFFKKKPKDASPGVPKMLASLVTNDNPDILATAYAPPKPDFSAQSPFDSLLKSENEKRGRFFPPIEKNDHAWARQPLPAYAFSKREQKCLAEGIYFEARGEPVSGQAAVAQVVLNRVRNPAYPNTICGVVYQNKSWRNRCQFSFACDGIRDRINSPRSWKTAQDVAIAVSAGKIWFKEVGSSTHYHATYVNPRWARHMKRVGKIGLHIFYRTYGGGWS
ncbi:cell wall hydrolase [Ahrensia marina]|uniref:cell wall hydrolase n=1 Tax=Ahrensia marina TaxID=1514904 RepID=UPI0009E7D9D1|nr:cell wall hydrolase [Ahrensia marina]